MRTVRTILDTAKAKLDAAALGISVFAFWFALDGIERLGDRMAARRARRSR